MIISWVEIKGVKEAIKSLDNIQQFQKSPEYSTFQHKTEQYARLYWRKNIYNWFDARTSLGYNVTNQLGNSLSISVAKKRITFTMSPIYSRTDGREYGRLLREGFDPSPGGYSALLDRRVKGGMHPGYDANTRWIPWIDHFRSRVSNKSGDYFKDAISRYLRRTFN